MRRDAHLTRIVASNTHHLRLAAPQTTATVQCPWCFEQLEVWIDPYTVGELIRDCEVCCRPWLLHVSRDASGRLEVRLRRSN